MDKPKQKDMTVAKLKSMIGQKAMIKVLDAHTGGIRKHSRTKGDKISSSESPRGVVVGIEISATIMDVAWAFGNMRVLIKPVGGTGSVWCSYKRVRLVDEFPFEADASDPFSQALAGD